MAGAEETENRKNDREGTLWVLLVEDDLKLAALTRKYLESHGLIVTHAVDGVSGLAEALRSDFDAILLDGMLPGKDGLEVCREIRAHRDTPILMLTARGEEADRVLGLEGGADDYIPKPFSSRELLARIRAQVRRARGQAGPSQRSAKVGDLKLEPATLTATLRGEVIPLTAYEFSLLRALAENAGRVLSREQLLNIARGNAEQAFDRSIDVHVHRLRQKLGDDPRHPTRLKTIRGQGYMLVDDESGGSDG